MKIKNFKSYNFSLEPINKQENSSRQTKKNLFVSSNSKTMNKKYKNYIYISKKEPICKSIFKNLLSKKENNNDYSLNVETNKKIKMNKLFDTNDINVLKKNLDIINIELNMLDKMNKDNSKNLDKLFKNLADLHSIKDEQKKLLVNYISKKETLDDMSLTIIKNIKNNDKSINNHENYNINISLEELYINNKELYINRIFKVFNSINKFNDKKYYDFIKSTIEEGYSELISNLKLNHTFSKKNCIDNFFYGISLRISNKIKNNSYEKSIKILLTILLKINVLSEKINKILYFLEKEYKFRKKEINKNISEIESKLVLLKLKKDELIESRNKINEKIDIFSKKRSPFCERVIHKKTFNEKNTTLNYISSSINFSTDFINKSNSNNFDLNKSIFNLNNSGNYFINKDRNNKEAKKDTKNINNKRNNTGKSHSNRISESYICINGLHPFILDKKSKITRINFNNLKKEESNRNIKTERNNFFKNKKQSNYCRRNNAFKIIKDFKNKKRNLTDVFNDNNKLFNHNNEIRLRKNKKYFDNGISLDFVSNKNSRKMNKIKVNNGMNEKNIKTEMNENEKRNNIQKKNKIVGELNPIYKNNIFSNFKSLSLEKQKNSNNIKSWKNIRNKFMLNKKKVNTIENKNKYTSKINNKIKNNSNINNINTDINLNKKENLFIKKKIDSGMKSFCYYKYLEKDSSLFNPLTKNIDLQNSEYNEGLISLDILTNSIKLRTIRSLRNEHNFLTNRDSEFNYSYNYSDIDNISIGLKEITNVYLNKLMENIIKIHSIFLKFNENNDRSKENGIQKKKIYNINKILNSRDIMNIKDMNQSDKIKASLCNFFSLILEYKNIYKIEIILINFSQFNSWLNYLKDILNNNIKSKNFISNGSSNSKNKNGKYTAKYKKYGIKIINK